jgi:uncharacterized membrane protein
MAARPDTSLIESSQLEILSLHEKIDELRKMKWAELITMQQEQFDC